MFFILVYVIVFLDEVVNTTETYIHNCEVLSSNQMKESRRKNLLFFRKGYPIFVVECSRDRDPSLKSLVS